MSEIERGNTNRIPENLHVIEADRLSVVQAETAVGKKYCGILMEVRADKAEVGFAITTPERLRGVIESLRQTGYRVWPSERF